MTRNKKRPQYVIDMLNDVNAYLRFRKVKDENDTLFCWMRNYLMDKRMYNGYNYHKYGDKIINPETGERNIVIVLAGFYKKDEFDFLQIW